MSSSNNITNVALVGGTGNLGSQVLIALSASKRFNITLITRSENPTLPASVDASQLTIKTGSYTDSTFLSSALAGIDAVILALHFIAVPEPETTIIAAAAQAGVKYIFPVEYGGDVAHPLIAEIPVNAVKEGPRRKAEELGIKWIGVVTGPWIDYSLKMGMFQINASSRSVTLLDEGIAKFNTTTTQTVGKVITMILSLPIIAEAGKGIERFVNRHVYVSSFLTSQGEILDAVLKATGTEIADWKVDKVSAEEYVKDGKDKVAKGDFSGVVAWLFGTTMSEGNGGNFEESRGLINDVLGLDKEDLEVVVRNALRA